MGDDLIQVRLDRALSSNEWFNHYQCSLSAIFRIGSDHFPVIFTATNTNVKRHFSFRFERMWLDHPNLAKAIEKRWSIEFKGTTMYRISKKLKNVKHNIKNLNKEVFGDLFATKTKTQMELKEMQDKIQSSGYKEVSINEENEVMMNYHRIIRREEELWKQRSRSLWIKVGDKNTRFFHMTALKHKAANRISKLKNGENEIMKDEEIGKEATNFFTSMLLVDHGLNGQFQNTIINFIPPIISKEQNKDLVVIPSEEEVREALFSFEGNKAPNPDGFLLFFFQTFWDILKADAVKSVQEFFGARRILKELNATFLVLNPKFPGVESMDKFRPISLCNSFYKIISKVVTYRLLRILPLIISPQ